MSRKAIIELRQEQLWFATFKSFNIFKGGIKVERDTAVVEKIQAYGWGCPSCGTYNLTDKDCPLVCYDCDEEFDIDLELSDVYEDDDE